MTEGWLEAFIWTHALELPIYVALLRRHLQPWWAPVALALLASSVTHPTLWLIFPHVTSIAYVPRVVIAEAMVVVVEAGLIRAALGPGGWRRAVSVSLLANAFSTVVGMALRQL